jgi:hypothetical protein
MKGKESKRAFIFFHLFFGIGTFQRVTADSNKKTFPRPAPSRRLHPVLNTGPKKQSKRLGGHWEINSTGLGFSQHNVAGSLPPE